MLLLIRSYDPYSESVKNINSKLPPTNKTLSFRDADIVLNWGCSEEFPLDLKPGAKVWNKPKSVKNSINKKRTFELFSRNDVQTVEFTFLKEEALKWAEKDHIICRTSVKAADGRGIVIATKPQEVVDAPLYTKYKKKKEEYRIHTFDGKAFLFQHKVPLEAKPDFKIRNTQGKWTLQNIREISDQAKEIAEKAVACTGLLFGAVDLIYNQYENKFYALEVNSAPLIGPQSAEKYVEQFRQAF